jgi:hypothetical protein
MPPRGLMEAKPAWIYTREGGEYYPLYIRRLVNFIQSQLWDAVYEKIMADTEVGHRFKGLDWNDPFDHSKGATIRFKDGIGFKVTIELDHAPTITD